MHNLFPLLHPPNSLFTTPYLTYSLPLTDGREGIVWENSKQRIFPLCNKFSVCHYKPLTLSSVSQYVSQPVCFSVCKSISQSVFQSISHSFSHPVCLYSFLSVNQSVSLFSFLSVSQSVILFSLQSVSESVLQQSVCPSVNQSVGLPVNHSISKSLNVKIFPFLHLPNAFFPRVSSTKILCAFHVSITFSQIAFPSKS
jgi:hypothetical protein